MIRKLSANMFWTCIDDMDNDSMHGTLYSTADEEDIVFHDFNQMVLKADAFMDKIAFPQAFQNKRSFVEEEHQIYNAQIHTNEKRKHDEIIQHHGKLFTGIIMVDTRQYSNWQGCVMNEQFEMLYEIHDVIELMKQHLNIMQKKES